MKLAKHALVTVALVVSASCTGLRIPATAPPPAAEDLHVAYTPDTEALINLVATSDYEDSHNVRFDFRSGNHHLLLESVLAGDTLYFITHHIPAQNTLSLWSAPLVQDAVAIVVHPDNPVANLSIEQLRRIYRGHITNWSDVGGEANEILIYSREAGAATRLEFERLVMGQQQTSPNARVLSSNDILLTQIGSDPYGIGYAPLSRVDNRVRVLAIETILPSLTTVIDNRYPLRTTIYVIGLTQPTDSYLRFFVNVQSLEVQETLSQIYAPLPR